MTVFDEDKCDFSYRQEYINVSAVIEKNTNFLRIDDQMNNSIFQKSLLSSSLAHLKILGWIIRKRDYYENCALYSARVYTYLRDLSNVDKYAINNNYTWEAIP